MAEVIERQEELADRCEALDPSTMEEVPVAEGFLRWAVQDVDETDDPNEEQRLALDRAAVRAMRGGTTPELVAEIMGVDLDEVLDRYSVRKAEHSSSTSAPTRM